MPHIELDFAYDEDSVHEAIGRVESAYNLKVEVISYNGPAGGWPELRFIGIVEDIKTFLKEDYADEDGDYDRYIQL